MVGIDINPKQLYEGCIEAAIAHAVVEKDTLLELQGVMN